MNQCDVPFYWHFSRHDDLETVLKSNYIWGIVFSYKILHEWLEAGKFEAVMGQILPIIYPYVRSKNINLVLSLEMGTFINERVLHYLSIETLSYFISSNVEESYRNINERKIENSLLEIKESYL